MLSLQQQLENFFAAHDAEWIAGGTMERTEFHGKRGRSKPGTVGRTLRSMEHDRIIAARHVRGYVEYRFIPTQYREKYRTLAARGGNGTAKLWG